MPKLYYWPATCALTIHVLLEEIGKPYVDEPVDLGARQQHSPEFLAVNPKGKLPAFIRDDGSLLTEVPAIAFWLARTNPQAKLISEDIETQTRTLEAMEYIAATIHMQGAARAWRPGSFVADESLHDELKARGKAIVLRGLDILAQTLGERPWLMGDYSIADASLFFIEYWAKEKVFWPMPDNIDRHYSRMRERPAVRRALAREGLA